jgi:tetratricopeptide (TPR) repeat protein
MVGVATIATLGASWAHDRATDAAAAGDGRNVLSSLYTATRLDPSFALYHRERGVWLQATRDLPAALAELTTAMSLNPSDAVAYRATALLYAELGLRDEAIALVSTKVALEETHIENALTLALINSRFGDADGERAALVLAVRRAPWLTAAPDWPAAFPDAMPDEILLDAFLSWQGNGAASARSLPARTWLAALTSGRSPADASLPLELQGAVLSCRLRAAEQTLSGLGNAARQLDALQARLLFETAFGGTHRTEITTLIRLRNPGLAGGISEAVGGISPVWSSFYDNRYYDQLAILPATVFALPTAASGLSAWLRDPVSAADRGAPGSGLAECR